jgi:murein DD-endopeptidase MepM/ murein hydrolase activator NlpD
MAKSIATLDTRQKLRLSALYFNCPSTIKQQSKVNLQAKLARHARIQSSPDSSASPSASEKESKKQFFNSFWRKLGLDFQQSVVGSLIKRIVGFSLAFVILSAFVPLYNYTEGHHMQDYDNYVFPLTEGDTESILSDMITEDGFLIKPALPSEQGDRSTANEVFAYVVEPGDTISSIAQRFGIKKQTLIMENNLWNANKVRAGVTLKILPVDGISHTVKKGDTVSKIAEEYDVKAEDIMRQNRLEEGEDLLVDSALIIPGGKRKVAAPVPITSSSSKAPSVSSAFQYSGGTANGRLIWPALSKAKLTQGYHRGHYAIDIANRGKGPIYAAAGGKVVRSETGWNGGYGNVIIIDHGDGMQTLYAHNEKLYVSVGQYVEQGQTIAWMGNTGRVYGATGIHLHFEVRINGVKYNPMSFF